MRRQTARPGRTFSPVTSEVREARRYVAARVPASIAADAALAVSELAANAVLHAGTPFTVRVSTSTRAVRVEVTDRSAEPPVVRPLAPDRIGGRGLHVVTEVTSRWGAEATADGGKCVWFEIDRRTTSSGG